MVITDSNSWVGGSEVIVRRTSAASPPIEGTFDLLYGDRQLTGSQDYPYYLVHL